MKNNEYDVCIVGSGAGGGPRSVYPCQGGIFCSCFRKRPLVLKKNNFFKDELATGSNSPYTPNNKDEPHVIEVENKSREMGIKTFLINQVGIYGMEIVSEALQIL